MNLIRVHTLSPTNHGCYSDPRFDKAPHVVPPKDEYPSLEYEDLERTERAENIANMMAAARILCHVPRSISNKKILSMTTLREKCDLPPTINPP